MRRGLWSCAAAVLLCVCVASAEESAWTLFEQGLKEFKKKRYDRAESIFDAAARMDARCEDAYYYLGQIKERKGLTREAEELYGKISDAYPTYSLAAERLGQIALRKGDKKAAVQHFRVYAEKRPTLNALLQLADVELSVKQYKEAEKTLKKAAKLSRGNLDIVDMFGRLYMETEEYGKALGCYNEILKKIPIDTAARFLRGTCLQRLDREGEAIQEWETVLKRDPYHGLALKALVAAYERDVSKASTLKDYKLRLKRLAKSKPPTRPVKGG